VTQVDKATSPCPGKHGRGPSFYGSADVLVYLQDSDSLVKRLLQI